LFFFLNGTYQKMPPKRSTRANPTGKEEFKMKPRSIIRPAQTRKTTKKAEVVQNKVPVIITPLKSKAKKVTAVGKKKALVGAKSLKSKGKKVTTVGKKKVLFGTKKLYAVMNVKTGAAREVTSSKTGMNFIKQVNGLCEGGAEQFKLFEFDTKEAMIAASAAIETNSNPVTAQSIQAATLSFGTPISLESSTPKQYANLKKPPPSNPMADLKQPSQAISTQGTKPSLSQKLTNQFAELKRAPATNPLANQIQSDLSSRSGTGIKLFMLPPAVCVAEQEKYQVFAIDLVENRTGQTLWTHKPDAWLQLFTTDKGLALEEGGHRADDFFHNLLVGYQRSQPKGPNVQKQVTTKNNKTIDYRVLWGMIKCTDDTEATLKTELMKFSKLASDHEIQEAYKVTVVALGTKYPALLDQISPTKVSNNKVGEYWKKLGAGCAGAITTVQCSSMDELFMDEEITVAVGFLWQDAGGLSTSMWSGDMNMFAFGRT
jgi:hypothetical protein